MRSILALNQVEIDFKPVAVRRAYHLLALSNLLDHALNHPLTRARFPDSVCVEQKNGDPFSLLAKIYPVRTSDHLDAITRSGKYANRMAHANGASVIFSTGGTTGAPVLLLSTYEEALRNAVHHGKGYWAAGIRPHHRVATFGGSGTFASEYCVYHALAQTGCTMIPINDFRQTENNLALLKELRATTLLTMPSEIFGLIDLMEERSAQLADIKLVVTGGEPISEQLKARLRARFGPDLCLGSTFQTADIGTIGYQCPFCADGEYHVHEELIYAEIETVEDEPELVLTNLDRRLMPALRLRSGDRAVWSTNEDACPCGRTSRRLKLLGRTKDIIKIGGEKVPSEAFISLPEALGIYEHLLKIEISQADDGKDRITIYADGSSGADLKQTIMKHFYRDPKLAQMFREGRCAPVEIVSLVESRFIVHNIAKHRLLVDIRT